MAQQNISIVERPLIPSAKFIAFTNNKTDNDVIKIEYEFSFILRFLKLKFNSLIIKFSEKLKKI